MNKKVAIVSAAVAAALVPISASWAAGVIVNEGDTYTSDISTGTGDAVTINGSVRNDRFVVEGSDFTAGEGSTIETGVLDLRVRNPNFDWLKAESITATESFTYRGGNGNNFGVTLSSAVKTPLLRIIGSNAQTGFRIENQSAIAGVDKFEIVSEGQRTGITVAGDLDFTGKPVYLATNSGTQNARIEVDNGNAAAARFGDVYVTAGKGVMQVNKDGALSVRSLHLSAGTTLNLAALGTPDANHAAFALDSADVGEDASLRLSLYGTGNASATTVRGGEDGSMTLNLAKDAKVDFGGWTNSDWRSDVITIDAQEITVSVADSSSDNAVYLSQTGLNTAPENIRVVAAANNNTGDAQSDLEKLAGIVQTNVKEGSVNTSEAVDGLVLEQAANDLYDAAYGEVADGGVTNVRTEANANINGIAEMTALGLHIWRNEIDDMHERLGELRGHQAQANGAWARVYNGKASFGGQEIDNKYTALQFGYDHQVDPSLFVGGAISYTYGDNSFEHGDGDSNLLAFAGYASKLWENGIYLDVTGKVGRMKNSFDISMTDFRSSGDYHTNAVSISAEAGWRFTPAANVFIEPQLEMWYGHVFDAQYQTSTGLNVDQAATDSLVGRAGVRLGIECPKNRGSAFIKASVLHDWEGVADFSFSRSGSSRSLTEDFGGTWYEYGIGADLNATNQLRFWAELERGDGGEVDTDYRATFGMRYAW